MKTIIFFLTVILSLVGCTDKKEVQKMSSTTTAATTPTPEDSAVITEYVAKIKSWAPAEYRIEENRRENGDVVYSVIYLADEKRSYAGEKKPLELGGGKSIEVYYDPVRHKVLKEMHFQ